MLIEKFIQRHMAYALSNLMSIRGLVVPYNASYVFGNKIRADVLGQIDTKGQL